jgi:hypothetical protein
MNAAPNQVLARLVDAVVGRRVPDQPREDGFVSARELARFLGVSDSTVFRLLRDLLETGQATKEMRRRCDGRRIPMYHSPLFSDDWLAHTRKQAAPGGGDLISGPPGPGAEGPEAGACKLPLRPRGRARAGAEKRQGRPGGRLIGPSPRSLRASTP